MAKPILVDENVFDELFIPEKLVAREHQIKEIARCLKPIKVGKSIKNLYVYGTPGVGKTLAVRWILKEYFENKSVYVNCWNRRTSHKIMEEILLQTGHVVHGKESTSDLVKKFEKSKRQLIVCLDEIDHVKDTDVLYVLARNSCGLVLISNEAYSLSNVDHRIMSRLFVDEIEFKPYSREDIFNILTERIKFGFRWGSFKKDLLSMVVGICNGDARIGLQTLRVSAREAESKNLDFVTIDEIRSAAKCARKFRVSYLTKKLNSHQLALYGMLKKNRIMDSGELFREYSKMTKENVTDRTYRNYMQRMQELELVKEISSGRWKKFEIV